MERDYSFIKKGEMVHYKGCNVIPEGDYVVTEIIAGEFDEYDDDTIVFIDVNGDEEVVFADNLVESNN